MAEFKLVLALDRNGVIGNKNKIPWKLTDDLKHFKKLTKGHPIIMGRKTYESLPGILPDREHIVLSKSLQSDEKISVFTSIKELVSYINENYQQCFVIGGAEIAQTFLKYKIIDEMWLSHVQCSAKGNIKIDLNYLDLANWSLINSTDFSKNDKNEHKFRISHYKPTKKRFY